MLPLKKLGLHVSFKSILHMLFTTVIISYAKIARNYYYIEKSLIDIINVTFLIHNRYWLWHVCEVLSTDESSDSTTLKYRMCMLLRQNSKWHVCLWSQAFLRQWLSAINSSGDNSWLHVKLRPKHNIDNSRLVIFLTKWENNREVIKGKKGRELHFVSKHNLDSN